MNAGVPGFAVGHCTRDHTGCTVVLTPEDTIGAAEVRGGAPATRETDLLDPTRTVAHVDAILLTGGSAFGLGAADGVMRFLVERGRGFPTAAGPVPIVPAAAVFDLLTATGPPPGAADGYEAARIAAVDGRVGRGIVGAGAGVTVGKWRGAAHCVPAGLGLAPPVVVDESRVAAVAVVNAVGDVVDDEGRVLAGSRAPEGSLAFPTPQPFVEALGDREHTTLVVVFTDAQLDAVGARLLAEAVHDGIARAVRPAHTRFDGDVAFALASGTATAQLDRLRIAAADVAAAAVRDAVRR